VPQSATARALLYPRERIYPSEVIFNGLPYFQHEKCRSLLVVPAAYVYMRVAVHPTITSQKNSRHEKIKCNLHISKSPYFLQNNKDNSGRGEVVLHGSMKTCSGCHTFTAELCRHVAGSVGLPR
jgi:hypothetical protein